MSLRLPEALTAWVQARAAATGLPVRRVIIEALETARMADEKEK